MNIKKLRDLMKIKKISQREISSKIGMTQSGFSSAVISGDFKVSTLERIAKVLEVPVGYFFDETGINGVNQKAVGLNINQNSGNNNNNNDCQKEISKLKQQVEEGLQRELKLKDEIINLLKNK